MIIDGTVTISLIDYELLKRDSERWENTFRIADDIKNLKDRINRSEMNKVDICNELHSIENKLRRGY